MKKYNKLSHYEKAQKFLRKGNISSARHACLELRYMIEAHVYDRIEKEIDIIPRNITRTWQPQKAIKLLMQLDEHADMDIQIEISGNGETKTLQYRNLSAKELNKYYNSLGSFLHLPTPGNRNTSFKAIKKIKQIMLGLRKITTGGNLIVLKKDYDSIQCEYCEQPIIYTSHYAKNNDYIDCQNENCEATYGIRKTDGGFEFGSTYTTECPRCTNEIRIPMHMIGPDKELRCEKCGTQYKFYLNFKEKTTTLSQNS